MREQLRSSIDWIALLLALRSLLAVTILFLWAGILGVDPATLDPLQLVRGKDVALTQLRYEHGHKAAIGALLSAVLLIDSGFLRIKAIQDLSFTRRLDFGIRILTIAVAISVGWQWLLDESQNNNPWPYFIPVLSFGLLYLLVALIAFGVFLGYLLLGTLVASLFRRAKPHLLVTLARMKRKKEAMPICDKCNSTQ